ncbi:hypothetical protein TSUD_390300 [Trifolium subterraneum]|uniref:Eukaryotic translation initiation factor 3 subunit E N-terminal domain-containing protein n=1 Tax=Trifolium subterraneum TaxID=3900 RepID=A0A2Z6N9C6_TRISU|nr:hypothetical protein TSUD_390300 [Trifolium subterraneum]
MDIRKTLYQTEDVLHDMVERRTDVVARFKSLGDVAAPLVAFLHNPSAVQELRADKLNNIQMLNDKYQIYLYGKATCRLKMNSYGVIVDKSTKGAAAVDHVEPEKSWLHTVMHDLRADSIASEVNSLFCRFDMFIYDFLM